MSRTLAFLAFIVCSWGSLAQAQRTAECEASREVCEAAMLAVCPSGVVVLEEQITKVSHEGTPVRRYRLRYRCADEEAARVGAQDSRGDARAAQLQALKAERARHSLAGPVSVLLVGLSTAGLMVWAHVGAGEFFPALVAADLFAVGITASGATWLSKVVRKRRAYDQEIRRLSLGTVALRAEVSRSRLGLYAALRF